jgi:pimeloyl-ACP methyl ester carboxylesterase
MEATMPRTMQLNGLTIAVDEPTVIARPPVLLIHGYGGGAWYFDRYQRFLAEHGYPSYALNLRGHCGSRPVDDLGRVSFLEYVEDAREVARHLGRPVVVGHSMGGLIAQKLAESDAVCAAVLLCAAPPRGISIFSASLALRQVKHLGALLRSRPLAGSRADYDALMFNCIPESERATLFPRFVADSGRVGRELSLGAVPVDERKVRCPMLVISCAEDHYVVPRVARRLARKYAAPHWDYPQHGHLPQYEPGWEVLVADIVRWLRTVVPRGTEPLQAMSVNPEDQRRPPAATASPETDAPRRFSRG